MRGFTDLKILRFLSQAKENTLFGFWPNCCFRKRFIKSRGFGFSEVMQDRMKNVAETYVMWTKPFDTQLSFYPFTCPFH